MSRLGIVSAGVFFMFPLMAHAGDLRADANAVFKPVDPSNVSSIVKNNDITPAKIDLGRQLFFEPRLSKSQVISCNSCHNLSTGGVDAGPVSIGHGWKRAHAARPPFSTPFITLLSFGTAARPILRLRPRGQFKRRAKWRIPQLMQRK